MSSGRRKLFEMIDDMDTAMFTTRRGNGQLVSRPMANQDRSAGADLWFVTYEGADKLKEIARDSNVNLTYYKDRTREWVSISGRAKISRDRKKIRELYKPDWRAWFGDDGSPNAGTPDDPRMVLVGVTITSATFLEQDKPAPVAVFELIKGIITRKPPSLGKERTVRPRRASTSRKGTKRSSRKR
ncbi:MAG TPA: pyridoxamine 5'-phosphate oxidase family protein [Thermoanaerobaculia bacterium]|nr:pyridoxamine 5'-phosphate oxidase family protein [Thermoanaerobaculia bacterium]